MSPQLSVSFLVPSFKGLTLALNTGLNFASKIDFFQRVSQFDLDFFKVPGLILFFCLYFKCLEQLCMLPIFTLKCDQNNVT